MKTLVLASLLAAGLLVPGRAETTPEQTPFQRNAALFMMKCAKCHTIGGGRRVGPDLRGAADRYPRSWLVGFIMDPDAYFDSDDPLARNLLRDNSGVRMENTRLTRAEVEGLLDFIKSASSAPLPPPTAENAPRQDALALKVPAPDEGMGVSPAGLVLLLALLAAAGLFLRFGAPRSGALAFAAAFACAYWAFGGRRHYRMPGNQQGYEPKQPLDFSHALHAGKLQIACLYCHSGAQRSDVAGVPAVNVCMNCHASVHQAMGSPAPSKDIEKVVAAWATRAGPDPGSIAWVRVHLLPDFVHFSHRVHIADNIQCQECHGPVQTMDRVRQAAPLTMGWCISCHRREAGTAPTHWKRAGGPLDCAACHW